LLLRLCTALASVAALLIVLYRAACSASESLGVRPLLSGCHGQKLSLWQQKPELDAGESEVLVVLFLPPSCCPCPY